MHDGQGIASTSDYQTLINACESGRWADFENIPLGGQAKLSNPLAAFSYALEGRDTHRTWTPPPPAFASDEQAGELVELYWQALTRDVPFSGYAVDRSIAAACEDLAKLGLSGTPGSLFRAEFPGCLTGPYISQFLWLDIPVGNLPIPQRYPCLEAGTNRLTQYSDFLDVQNGAVRGESDPLTAARYATTARDLASYVHRDFACQGYQNAALILAGWGTEAWSEANPYKRSATQSSFVSFGLPAFVSWVNRAAHSALQAAWYHKWLVHRRLRPEEFAGRVQNRLVAKAAFPISEQLFRSNVLDRVYQAQGSYLLAQAYDEGCPLHPSYPAAHAVIAGACVTVLKALFDESFAVPNPVVPTSDGSVLVPYTGQVLTVGGELNKLGANLALARNAAGVHWRSDTMAGLRLGESVGVALLQDLLSVMADNHGLLMFHDFLGQAVVVRPSVS